MQATVTNILELFFFFCKCNWSLKSRRPWKRNERLWESRIILFKNAWSSLMIQHGWGNARNRDGAIRTKLKCVMSWNEIKSLKDNFSNLMVIFQEILANPDMQLRPEIIWVPPNEIRKQRKGSEFTHIQVTAKNNLRISAPKIGSPPSLYEMECVCSLKKKK